MKDEKAIVPPSAPATRRFSVETWDSEERLLKVRDNGHDRFGANDDGLFNIDELVGRLTAARSEGRAALGVSVSYDSEDDDRLMLFYHSCAPETDEEYVTRQHQARARIEERERVRKMGEDMTAKLNASIVDNMIEHPEKWSNMGTDRLAALRDALNKELEGK